ncbi:hypothetical protein H5410_027320 [Solanum commersonii]|uniref:Uncharacterized protein n=1 Tax=Solanum commersonii TaxID=4109 RepID=A0A9J5Z324_SOLCO|nr:hypothetical protein H5410_027320 [Solanum commersonii]
MNKGTSQREQEVEQNNSFLATSVGHSIHVGEIVSIGTRTMQRENNSMQQMNLLEQQAIDQIAKKQASTNLSEDAQSWNFSFGIAGSRQQTKGKEVLSGKSNKENNAQTDATNTDAHLHNGVNEQTSRFVELSEYVNKQVQKAKEGQKEQHKDINQPGGTTRLQRAMTEPTWHIRTTSLRSPIIILGMILTLRGIEMILIKLIILLRKELWQKIQYEGIPNYCMYCKHQGHMENACTIKRRDQDIKKRKEMETEKKSKNKGEQEKGGTKIIQIHDSDMSGATTSSQHQQLPGKKRETYIQNQHGQEIPEQEDQWQTQKRKQNKNQEHSNPKTAWRPVSPHHKDTMDNSHKDQTPLGMNSRTKATLRRVTTAKVQAKNFFQYKDQ